MQSVADHPDVIKLCLIAANHNEAIRTRSVQWLSGIIPFAKDVEAVRVIGRIRCVAFDNWVLHLFLMHFQWCGRSGCQGLGAKYYPQAWRF